LPAPDVEPVERPPEILPLFGRRLYLLALRFQFLGTRVPRRQVGVGQAALFERYLVAWAEESPDADAKPLWQSFHGESAWPFFLECLATAAFLARSVAAGVPLIDGRGRLAFSLIAWRILRSATSEPHSGQRICVLTKGFFTSRNEYVLSALSKQEKKHSASRTHQKQEQILRRELGFYSSARLFPGGREASSKGLAPKRAIHLPKDHLRLADINWYL